MLQDLDTAVLPRAAAMYAAGDMADGSGSGDPATAAFLRGLGYAGAGSGAEPSRHRLALLRAAAGFERLFSLAAPCAPGLVLFGAVVRPETGRDPSVPQAPGSVTGSGLDFASAFESCVGEGVEFLSQFECDGDRIAPPDGAPVIDAFPGAAGAPAPSGDAVAATDLRSGDPILLPFERCIRPPGAAGMGAGPFIYGTGCGAGGSFAAAALHGLYELIERDAVALWWWGRRRGRPLAVEAGGLRDAADLLAVLRRGESGRLSWFLDLTTDIGVPAVAALSADEAGGYVACGTASRTTRGAALAAAIREMCQMELAYDVVRAKLAEGGPEALNAADRRHLGRAENIHAETCVHLHPSGAPRPPVDLADDASGPEGALQAVVARLAAAGAASYAVDLTRPAFQIPVVRAVVPALQLYPSDIVTPRLRQCFEAAGTDQPLYPLH
ncbi:YcaO-like family protein [Nisaea sp.]|uniref:YcaO-like family protein n=1 Tax=Nisaea sp. TaxID=2024842 RepID=UPI003B51D49D